MRLSRYLLATQREDPRDAEVPSHRWMQRAGMIRRVAAGVYDLLPTGLRAVRNVERIVREEMNRAGALEVQLPVVQPAELWHESTRWEAYGKELLRFRDRHERDFVLGPTHEEVIVDLVRREVASYKQLPLNLYQIHTKFRDEIRPRFGLMRGREFTMKDAYSFHDSSESLDAEYHNMVATYRRIFSRCGLEYRDVEADTGSIGGSASHEFMVLAETGEDAIAFCTHCQYAANLEKAEFRRPQTHDAPTAAAAVEVATPGVGAIDDVAAFLKTTPSRLIKTLVFDTNLGPVVACASGDREVSDAKVKNAVGADWAVLADPAGVVRQFGAPVGFLGPLGLRCERIVCDPAVMRMGDAVTGANRADTHIDHVVPGRDFSPTHVADLAVVRPGDGCPRCSAGILEVRRGIEVGHVFKLGTKYSEALKASILDRSGASRPLIMGCYGIGIGRTAAAAIEQNHDDKGMIWPVPLAPFHAVVLPLDLKTPALVAAATQIYEDLLAAGVDAALDDRDERAGVKLTDAEMLGTPYRIVLGKRGFEAGTAELTVRRGMTTDVVPLREVAARVAGAVRGALA